MKEPYRSEVLKNRAAKRLPHSHKGVRCFSLIVGGITYVSQAFAAFGLLVCLVSVSYGVVMRYVFNDIPYWVDDTVSFVLVAVVMFAASATYRTGEHIAVDILTGKRKDKGWFNAWSIAAVTLFSLLLIMNGWKLAEFSQMLGIYTSGNVEIPIFWLQILLPIGGALLLMVCVEKALIAAVPNKNAVTEEENEAC